jgi:hypothetical protein
MKILFSCIILSVLLLGRSNPFEATDDYLQKKQELLDAKAKEEAIKREKKIAESKKIFDQIALKQQNIIDESITAQVVEEIIENEQIEPEQNEQLSTDKKEVESVKVIEKIEVIKIENFELLPFLSIKLADNNIQIDVDEKYKFKNQMILHKEGKFIFDFRGKVSFYTKRKNFEHPYFESIVIGNHPEKSYFRIVVKVKNDIKNYKEKIDSKANKFIINKI